MIHRTMSERSYQRATSRSSRGVTNSKGGEYDTYHEYQATNTTIYI